MVSFSLVDNATDCATITDGVDAAQYKMTAVAVDEAAVVIAVQRCVQQPCCYWHHKLQHVTHLYRYT